MKPYDTVIIGGGVAGLMAAVELGRAGKPAILVEKSNRVGGRAITVRKNGALFNLGGHAIYKGGEAYAILKQWGIALEGGQPTFNGSFIWNDQAFPLANPAKLLLSSFLSWSGKGELVKLFWKLFKSGPIAVRPGESLREWAERELRDPMVRHIFYSLTRTATYTRDPDYQLAGPALKQVQRSLKSGVQYLHGGWQSIVDQLREKAVQAGVKMIEHSAAARVVHEGGAVRQVELEDGTVLAAAHVISTVSPEVTFRLVPGAERTVLSRWKDEARPAMAACLDLCLERLPSPDRQVALGLDRPVFFSNHSAGAKLTEDGKVVVHLMKYNGPTDSDPAADLQLLEQTMSLLHPGWEQLVAAKQFLPNIAVVHDYAHLGRKQLEVGPSVPEIKGLYVAGDWASHGEYLLDAAATSARRAVGQVLGGAYRTAVGE
ncbi:phytoene desaturase family protein [Paenibacillus koleovorans]|uniref:phytoene desaturase family protein n=1 Tax=Paenibacillus koleovorans TaxID=121608 RepID=UPI001FE360AE|nr:FAD-dependent oxidoreductase [Paenibacillus koleovorans]